MKTPTDKWREEITTNLERAAQTSKGLWAAMDKEGYQWDYSTIWRAATGKTAPSLDLAVAMRDVSRQMQWVKVDSELGGDYSESSEESDK